STKAVAGGARRGVRPDSPAAILHRGTHAADRARGHSHSQRHSCAARRRGAAGGEDPPDRLSLSHECSGFRERLPPEVARAWLRRRRNIAIEYRWADGKYERLPELAAELVRLRVEVILAVSNASRARRQKRDQNDPHRLHASHRSCCEWVRRSRSPVAISP